MLLRTVAVLALVLHAQTVVAQNPPGVLRGLRSVVVTVEFARTEQAGAVAVDTASLRIQTELELRRAGVLVEPSAHAQLAVSVVFVGEPNGVAYAYHSSVSLRELVALAGRSATRVFYATTWEDGATQVTDATNISQNIADAVHRLTERFLNDYLAANPPRR